MNLYLYLYLFLFCNFELWLSLLIMMSFICMNGYGLDVLGWSIFWQCLDGEWDDGKDGICIQSIFMFIFIYMLCLSVSVSDES